MNTQTSLVAEQVRLQQWAEQIKECQNRPADMKVDIWWTDQGKLLLPLKTCVGSLPYCL